MGQMSQEQINVDLFDEVVRLKKNWETLYQFLENTDKLSNEDSVMLIDLMDDIKNGIVK